MKRSKVAAGTVLILTAILMCWSELRLYTSEKVWIGTDFWGYYTAAWIVRSHCSPELYSEEASNKIDPLERLADRGTFFAQVAAAHQIPEGYYFIYPPVLADLLFPFTAVPATTALYAWYAFNVAALLWVAFLLAHMTGTRLATRFVLVLAFLLVYPPTAECLIWAQAPILLLLILLEAVVLYVRQRNFGAACLIALAAAVKLTPLVVLVPLCAWRDWKTLRAVVFCGASILLILLCINGWATLDLYFLHELPRIGSKYFDDQIRTLGAVVEAFWPRSKAGTLMTSSIWTGKLLSALVLCLAGWLSRSSHNETVKNAEKVEAIALFLLLSCCVAPVSWLHGYVLSAPALLFVGQRIWENRIQLSEAAVALLFIISFVPTRHSNLELLTPLLGIVLALMGLLRLRGERRSVETQAAFLTTGGKSTVAAVWNEGEGSLEETL